MALAFLTRLPGGVHPADGDSLGKAVPWFPFVGAVVGGLAGLVYLALEAVVQPGIAALGAIGAAAMLTGAFHEDGLADTFDGFGGTSPKRRLEIMRDSRIGTFGTLALVVATGAKVVALAPLSGIDGLAALVAAHVLGRAGALTAMTAGPEARTDGLAARAADLPRVAVNVAVVAAMGGAVALGRPTAEAVPACLVISAVVVVIARRQFGGTTGDVLGAVEQLGEIATLVIVAEALGESGWLWV